MNDVNGPQSRNCPRCHQTDLTEFSTCRHCGTNYDWTKPKQVFRLEDFDLGDFLRSPQGWFIFGCIILVGNLCLKYVVPPVLHACGYVPLFPRLHQEIRDQTARLDQDSKNYDLLVARAKNYETDFRLDLALQDLSSAIQLRPNNVDLYRRRAEDY